MATLYFKIGADYENVIRLRDEIKKLENQLRSFGKSTPETQIRQTEERLATTRQEFVRLTTEAAKAGAVMESDLKRKINSVTKASDELSEEIIKQRKIIRDTQDDVRHLSEQYSKIGKYSPQSSATLAQLNKAKSALNEQKYALGELQGQQASNRLELRQLTRQYREFSEETDKSTVTVDALMSSLKRTAAEIGGLAAIKKFGTDVIDATGKMQQLQVALSTILQSKSKADALLAEVTEFARKTPFNLDDVANGVKQLLAYGSSAETVVDELSMLGDVASGLQIPLGSLIYLYGTLRVQGRAYWRDIQQFQGRGVNVVEEMAKNLGVTQDQIKKLVEEGKIGFKDVEKAFQSMTSEGGKFNNMLENAAGTWPQRIANLEDTLFTKLVDFGNKYKEVFEFGIGTAEELVEHLDDVISVIGSLIAAYGSYKAALIAVAAWQKAGNLLSMAKKFFSLAKGVNVATAAMKAFNVASKANLFGALLSIITGVTTAVYMFTKRTNNATVAQEALSKVNKKADEEFSSQAATIDRLNGVLRSETASLDQKKKALGELQSIIPDYNASLNEEGKLINNNTEAIKAYLVQLEKQIKLKAAQEELEELYRNKRLQEKNVQTQQANYDRTRKQNPIGVVYGGDAGIEAQRLSLDRIAKAEKSLKDANDELKDTQTQIASIEKEIEQVSLASSKAQKPTSSLSSEIKNASEKIRNLKKEISGLRSGNIKAEAGKTVEKTIEAKTKELQATEKTLETLTGKSNKTSTRIENQRKKSAEERKKAQEELNKELLALEQKNQDDEIALMRDGTEKKLAEIDNDYKKRIAEIERQEAEFKEKNKEAGITGLGVNGLTNEQQNALQEAADNAAKERERQTQEVYAAEAQAMRDYLKEYGTFQQQKLAIAEEYAEKIKNAQSEGERLSLTAERDRALQQTEINAIKQDIDWGSVFGDFGTMFRDQLQPTIDRLRQIAGSDAFRQSSLEDQKTLYELIEKLENANAAWDSDIFKRVSDDMKAYQEAMHGYAAAVDKARIAEEKLADAKSTLDAAKRGGLSQETINAAQSAVDEAQEAFNAASEEVTVFGAQVQETTTSLNSSATEAKAMFDGLAEGLRGLSSGSLQGIGEGVMSLDKLFGGNITQKAGNAIAKGFQSLLGKDSNAAKTLSAALGESGMAGQIVSAVLSMLDILKDGIGNLVSSLIDTVLGSVNGILDDIFSGGIITKPLQSVVDGVGGILDTITFGGFSSWTSSSNAKEVQATIDRLTDRNESLQSSIEALNDTIKDSNGAIKSVDAAEQAKEYQQEVNQNYLEMAKAQAGYHGSHHSWNYYWGGFSQGQIDKLSEQIGRDWNGNLWDLSPEEMKILKGNVDMWTQIQNTGKGGYGGRLAEKLDDYIDQAGKLEEIENTLNETLTQISFDSVYDSFIDTLMDMEASAEDFADDFSEYMMRAMLSDKIGTMFKDRIQEWYTAFAEAMKDGVLTDDELKQLRKEWNDIAADATAERDKLAEATGYDKTSSSASQQQASSKGFETMSQDMAGELSGRFTALNETGLRIEAQGNAKMQTLADLKGSVAGLTVQAQGIYNIADETRSILANSYLELKEINENTGISAKCLKGIQADIAIVKQNTSRI